MRGVGLSQRGAFLRKSGPPHDADRLHLHIICTNEDRFGLVLVAQLCSLEASTKDRACLLGLGDHPFIDRRSFIHYGKSVILQRCELQESLRRGDIFVQDDCTDSVFELICEGFGKSKATRPKTAAYFREWFAPLPDAA